MNSKVNDIITALKGKKFNVENEMELQRQMSEVFTINGIKFNRGYELDKSSLIDFFCDGVGIEVKIKGGKRDIFRQCERYCQFSEITDLLLVTSKSMGIPNNIDGKPVYYINISRAWL